MVPGGAGSTWGLAEEQPQALAVICFALRNTFPPLNAFSWWGNFNVSASDKEAEPPNRRRM